VTRLLDNHLSMKVPEGVLLSLKVRSTTFFLASVLLLPVACVSLDKPPKVAECAAKNRCTDNVVPGDDKDAAVAPLADVRVVDEPTGPKEDLGPDSLPFADTVSGKTDVSGGKDVGGTQDSALEVAFPPETGGKETLVLADVRPEPADVLIDPLDVPAGDDLVNEDVLRADVMVREDLPRQDLLREDLVIKQDVPGLETSDAASHCTLFYGASPSTGSSGHPPGPGSSAEFCVATCDDIAGWGCSNFDPGRKVTVNGTAVNCGDPITKKNGYYVFQVTAGTNSTFKSAVVYWWSTNWAATCAVPEGGF